MSASPGSIHPAPARLSRQHSPRSTGSSPVTTPPAKPSQLDSTKSLHNTDLEYVVRKSGSWNVDQPQSHHPERQSVFEDVTIPTNILRYANIADGWAPKAGVTVTKDRQHVDSMSNFNVVDIALEQQAVIDYALGNPSAGQASHSSHTQTLWDHGQANKWRQTNLPILAEEKDAEGFDPQRRDAFGTLATRAFPRTSVDIRDRQNNVLFGPQMNDTILFRSLDSYALNEAAGVRRRRYSSAVPPDADYLAVYKGSMEVQNNQPSFEESLDAAKEEPEQLPQSSAIRRASVAIASAYHTATQGTTDLMRKSSLWDAYENAKIRGQHLQRKRWVQVVFEYTFYLVLLSFVYFVLIGRPLWNGVVWYLYWVIDTQFTVPGTWSIVLGIAIM
jgi:hypothetical protein